VPAPAAANPPAPRLSPPSRHRHRRRCRSTSPSWPWPFSSWPAAVEQFAAGTQIFAENEKTSGFFSKGARIYLLLDGDVTLTRGGKPLELVLPGEIFGEMAAIAEMPRSATATARKPAASCRWTKNPFLQSLQQMPEFALMLMSVMAQRLRRGLAGWPRPTSLRSRPWSMPATLDKKMLADLQHALGDPTPSTAAAGKTVVTKGAVGACMFVVTEGASRFRSTTR
jgi:CRP/FNR family cyclic AMP-dependent transcriptional regulator